MSPKPTNIGSVVLVLAAVAGSACSATPEIGEAAESEETRMVLDEGALAGHWRRVDGDPCGERYPSQIEFRTGGTYLSATTDQRFYLWQSGDYELLSEGRIRIQSATDAMLSYTVDLRDDTLSFRDVDGCEVRYRRVQDPED